MKCYCKSIATCYLLLDCIWSYMMATCTFMVKCYFHIITTVLDMKVCKYF